MISIRQASEKGITRLKNPIWANENDHIDLTIIRGQLGPWVRLYSPINKEINGRDPVKLLLFDFNIDEECWVEYDGCLPGDKDYMEINKP